MMYFMLTNAIGKTSIMMAMSSKAITMSDLVLMSPAPDGIPSSMPVGMTMMAKSTTTISILATVAMSVRTNVVRSKAGSLHFPTFLMLPNSSFSCAITHEYVAISNSPPMMIRASITAATTMPLAGKAELVALAAIVCVIVSGRYAVRMVQSALHTSE